MLFGRLAYLEFVYHSVIILLTGQVDFVFGQVILFLTCPVGQVDLKTSVKPWVS